MMKRLITLSLCFLSICTFGQNVVKVNGSNMLGSEGKGTKIVIDSAALKCYYVFSKRKKGADKPYRTDTMALEIGNKISRFYDPSRLGRDSLLSAQMKNLQSAPIKSVSVFKGDKAKDLSNMPGTIGSASSEGESYQIYKNKSAGKISVVDYVSALGDKFQYEEEIGTLPWKITNTIDTIQSYPCQKATLKFRGRDYTVWFAPEIPVGDGPWKFMGLPGLILKAEDSQQLFSFSLIGLEQLTVVHPIFIDNPKKTIKCTRSEFENQKKKQGAGSQINVNGGDVIIADLPGNYDYNPMETE